MIKSLCKVGLVLGLGSLGFVNAASVTPTAVTASSSTDYRTYLDYKGIGLQTMDKEVAIPLFSSNLYFSVNEALQVEQLQKLISNQVKVMAELGINSTPSWQDIDSTTNSLIGAMSKNDPFVLALLSQHSLSQPLNGVPFISVQMNSYVANLMVLANQNEAAIFAKLQSCTNQGSLQQCVGAPS